MAATLDADRPRRARADGLRSRQTILDAASGLATVDGLEGLSIGRLAEHIGMSKSGLYAHFGSKEELQLATIENAGAIFVEDVIRSTEAIVDPLEQLEALCDAFLSHLERRVFPGGCFFVSVAAEFDTRPGPIKDRIAEFGREWLGRFAGLVRRAQEQGLVDRDADPDQVAFELDAYLLLANSVFVLVDDPVALERARTACRARLALLRTTR